MSDTLVLYTSKYGSTRQYAEWIAAELGADLHVLSTIDASCWGQYATIVVCGGVYANTINGMKAFAKNQAALEGKKIVIVACGLSDPHSDKVLKQVEKGLYDQFPQAAHWNARLFLVQGGIKYAHMRLMDKAVMKFLEKALRMKKPEALSPEERQMLAALGKDSDYTDRSAVQPIAAYCRT